MMPDSLNHDLHDALKEAGADEKSARMAARSVAGALDMAKALIWIKALTATVGMLVAVNAVMLNQLFTLTETVGRNTAAIDELRRGQEEIRRGQDEMRRRQDEILLFLQNRLSDNGAGGDSAPAISIAPTPTRPIRPARSIPSANSVIPESAEKQNP